MRGTHVFIQKKDGEMAIRIRHSCFGPNRWENRWRGSNLESFTTYDSNINLAMQAQDANQPLVFQILHRFDCPDSGCNQLRLYVSRIDGNTVTLRSSPVPNDEEHSDNQTLALTEYEWWDELQERYKGGTYVDSNTHVLLGEVYRWHTSQGDVEEFIDVVEVLSPNRARAKFYPDLEIREIACKTDFEAPVDDATRRAEISIDLSSDQKKVVLDFNNSSSNMFVTGGAGVGKSTVLKVVKSSQKWTTHLHNNQAVVLSSSNISAMGIGARTVHSFFGIGTANNKETAWAELNRAGNEARRTQAEKRIRNTHILIIDEISMINAELFDWMDEAFREFKQSPEPWGGVQVLLFGDFLQLPPVNAYPLAFQSKSWKELNIATYLLTSNHRQAADGEFFDLLNQVRIGSLSDENRNKLARRTNLSPPENVPRIFTHRNDVAAYNAEKLSNLMAREYHFNAKVRPGREQDMSSLPIERHLVLKIGAQVMIRANDPQGRYVNGTIGYVQSVDIDTKTVRVNLNGNTSVRIEEKTFSRLSGEGNEIIICTALPLTLGYAMTVHKCQGLTFEALEVDLQAAWEAGQCYVALSRAQTLQGLFIRGLPENITVNSAAFEFYRNLETSGSSNKLNSSSQPDASAAIPAASMSTGANQEMAHSLVFGAFRNGLREMHDSLDARAYCLALLQYALDGTLESAKQVLSELAARGYRPARECLRHLPQNDER